MVSSTDWIKYRLEEAKFETEKVYKLYNKFCDEFEHTPKLNSYKRRVRRLRENMINRKNNNVEEKYETKSKGVSCDNRGDSMILTGNVDHIMSVEELLEHFEIDKNDWEIERVKTNVWEMGRKDREIDITYTKGKADGHIYDTGGVNKEQLYQITVWLRKKKHIVEFREIISELMENAKAKSPKQNIARATGKGFLYEICIFDPHFGLRAWAEESGEDYNLKIAANDFNLAVDTLLTRIHGYTIDKIVLPIGNDFFNVDNKAGTTNKGTNQDEDASFQRSFIEGFNLLRYNIDKMTEYADVDIFVVPGNHDTQRCFYLGHSLECWYHNNENVTIDNSAFPRKYVTFGNTLLGYCHQHNIKESTLPLVMAVEAKDDWAKSEYREWRIGHKHTKKKVDFITTEEYTSIRIRRIAAMTARSAWTTEHGFNAVREAEGFLWDYTDGNIGRFSWKPKKGLII